MNGDRAWPQGNLEGKNKATVASRFREQLIDLIARLDATSMHFVRCVAAAAAAAATTTVATCAGCQRGPCSLAFSAPAWPLQPCKLLPDLVTLLLTVLIHSTIRFFCASMMTLLDVARQYMRA